MKLIWLPVSCSILLIALSCGSNGKASLLKSDSVFIINREAILRNYMIWYGYDYSNIKLSQDFTGLDKDSNQIEKRAFLNQLIKGGVVPFKIRISDSLPVYKLSALPVDDSGIQSTIQQVAQNELFNYEMEGKELPDFNFTDLNGNHYNKSSVKGKTMVLKCWFIKCVACVKEFPELNKLVDEYKDRKDVLFISLAMDMKPDLISFFKEKEFRYATVAQQKNYIENKLKLYEFPTHVLIDKNGKIVKVTNSIEEMIPYIKKLTH